MKPGVESKGDKGTPQTHTFLTGPLLPSLSWLGSLGSVTSNETGSPSLPSSFSTSKRITFLHGDGGPSGASEADVIFVGALKPAGGG